MFPSSSSDAYVNNTTLIKQPHAGIAHQLLTLTVCMWAAQNKKDAKHEQFGNWVASVAMVPVTADYSGVGTNFVLGGAKVYWEG